MARQTIDRLSYAECARRMGDAPPRGQPAAPGFRTLKLAPNTWLERVEGDSGVVMFCVRFHSTRILRFYPSGLVVYDHGEYRTATTKERMNRFGPREVYQRGGVWFVGGDAFEGRTHHCTPSWDAQATLTDCAVRGDAVAGLALKDYLQEALGMAV